MMAYNEISMIIMVKYVFLHVYFLLLSIDMFFLQKTVLNPDNGVTECDGFVDRSFETISIAGINASSRPHSHF